MDDLELAPKQDHLSYHPHRPDAFFHLRRGFVLGVILYGAVALADTAAEWIAWGQSKSWHQDNSDLYRHIAYALLSSISWFLLIAVLAGALRKPLGGTTLVIASALGVVLSQIATVIDYGLYMIKYSEAGELLSYAGVYDPLLLEPLRNMSVPVLIVLCRRLLTDSFSS